MRAKRIARNTAVYIELSSGSRQVKGLLIRLVDTAAAATPSSVLEPLVNFFSDKRYSKLQTELFIYFRVCCIFFLTWLSQDRLQELKASKGRCPTREHRLPDLG